MAASRWKCPSRDQRIRAFVLFLVASLAGLSGQPAFAQSPPEDQAVPEPGPTIYLLSVRVNGWPLGLVARFHEEDGRLSMPAEQFDGLGFILDESVVTEVDGQRRVFLDALPGVTWQIDGRAQTIDIVTPFELLKPNVLHVSPRLGRVESRSNWGGLLAFNAFGEYSSRPDSDIYGRTLSLDVEARIFSPIFLASASGYYSVAEGEEGEFVRLDTSIDFDNLDRAWRLRLGDSLTTGPVWLRTLRFGGIQWGRDFSLRPDIVTTPVAVLDQNVSVPSTVDIFINEVRRYSRAVDPGAIRVTDLPVTAGSNRIRVVVTDRSGRRTEVILPLYTSSVLLQRGLSDFNIEVGAERRDYGVASNDYGPPFVSGSYSHGVTDRLTLRGYGAASRGYGTAVAGATMAVGPLFLFDGAAMFSHGREGDGWSFYGSVEHIADPLNLYVSYMRSSRDFSDLVGNFGYSRSIEQATASGGLNLGRLGQLNVAYALQRTVEDEVSSVASGSYSLDLFDRALHLGATGYVETREGDWGVILSLTIPLGRHTQLYAEHSWRNGIPSQAVSLRGEGFGNRLDWEIAGERGEFKEVFAEVGWDGQRTDFRLRAAHSGGDYGIRGDLAQSLIFMDDRLILAGRIDDAFTIVEVEGVRGVRVELENRTVGRTDSSGRLFVTGLNSYVANSVSIDPTDLPIDVALQDPAMLVSPRAGGGVVTRFPVSRESAAIIVLRRPDGSAPPVGARVALEGSEAEAVMGHDGEVYARGLRPGANRLAVSWRDGACTADFSAMLAAGTLPRLGPFQCAP
jgi:outer membrane usher protein